MSAKSRNTSSNKVKNTRSSNTKKKKGWFRGRIAKVFVGFCAFIFIASILIVWQLPRIAGMDFATNFINSQVSEATGLDFIIDDLELQWQGAQRVGSLVIKDPAGGIEVSVSINADGSLWNWIRGSQDFGTIVVAGDVAVYTQLGHVPNEKSNNDKKSNSGGGVESGLNDLCGTLRLDGVNIDYIEIKSGGLVGEPKQLGITDLTGELTLEQGGTLSVDIEAVTVGEGKVGGVSITGGLAGVLDKNGSLSIDAISGSLIANATGMPVGVLDGLMGQDGRLRSIVGDTLDISSQFDGDLDGGNITLEVLAPQLSASIKAELADGTVRLIEQAKIVASLNKDIIKKLENAGSWADTVQFDAGGVAQLRVDHFRMQLPAAGEEMRWDPASTEFEGTIDLTNAMHVILPASESAAKDTIVSLDTIRVAAATTDLTKQLKVDIQSELSTDVGDDRVELLPITGEFVLNHLVAADGRINILDSGFDGVVQLSQVPSDLILGTLNEEDLTVELFSNAFVDVRLAGNAITMRDLVSVDFSIDGMMDKTVLRISGNGACANIIDSQHRTATVNAEILGLPVDLFASHLSPQQIESLNDMFGTIDDRVSVLGITGHYAADGLSTVDLHLTDARQRGALQSDGAGTDVRVTMTVDAQEDGAIGLSSLGQVRVTPAAVDAFIPEDMTCRLTDPTVISYKVDPVRFDRSAILGDTGGGLSGIIDRANFRIEGDIESVGVSGIPSLAYPVRLEGVSYDVLFADGIKGSMQTNVRGQILRILNPGIDDALIIDDFQIDATLHSLPDATYQPAGMVRMRGIDVQSVEMLLGLDADVLQKSLGQSGQVQVIARLDEQKQLRDVVIDGKFDAMSLDLSGKIIGDTLILTEASTIEGRISNQFIEDKLTAVLAGDDETQSTPKLDIVQNNGNTDLNVRVVLESLKLPASILQGVPLDPADVGGKMCIEVDDFVVQSDDVQWDLRSPRITIKGDSLTNGFDFTLDTDTTKDGIAPLHATGRVACQYTGLRGGWGVSGFETVIRNIPAPIVDHIAGTGSQLSIILGPMLGLDVVVDDMNATGGTFNAQLTSAHGRVQIRSGSIYDGHLQFGTVAQSSTLISSLEEQGIITSVGNAKKKGKRKESGRKGKKKKPDIFSALLSGLDGSSNTKDTRTKQIDEKVVADPAAPPIYQSDSVVWATLDITTDMSQRLLGTVNPVLYNIEKKAGPIRTDGLFVRIPLSGDLRGLNADLVLDLGQVDVPSTGLLGDLLGTMQKDQPPKTQAVIPPVYIQIRDGILRYDRFVLQAQTYNITIGGSIDLVTQKLDMIAEVPLLGWKQVFGDLTGKGAPQDNTGDIPFYLKISGTVDDPKIEPHPQGAQMVVDEFIGDIIDKAMGDLLDGLFN